MQKNNKLSSFIRVTALLLLSALSTLVNAQAQTTITSLQQITNPAGSYIITDDINAAGFDTPIADFTGTLTSAPKQDGTFPVISNLTVPIFTTATDATISNIILDAINISYPSSVGAICCTANGATRIYNCGILSGEIRSTGNSTANNSTDCCGSLVGLLDGTARVINCYSFANITGGNRVAGIVGYNNYKTTAANIRTLVMNCMFYGDITDGNKVSPIYGGEIINNLNSGGLNTFNYYAYDRLKTNAITEGMYNCALAVEERYLTRFEFYRLMLNSNRSLAAYYASTLGNTVSADDMAKWVIETADKSISDPKPYPILKKKGKYPSIINYDVENAPSSSSTERNKGKKLGTLTVNINLGSGYPEGASITTSQLILDRTDKDFDRFNFNYDKVQLPYYNDVGTNNCTDNKVVTGWKITAITAVTDDPYTSANYPTTGVKDFPDHNYADRKSSNKDLYSVSKRVFSQGAYFDVPYGVESITIEPYWGKAAYVSDEYRDVVYKNDYTSAQGVSQLGKVFGVNGTSVQINGNSQNVYTSINNALNNLSGVTNPTVYDYAVVLVGNLHHSGSVPSGGDKPFTIMSIDLDKDNEPDCSFIYSHNSRAAVSPIRFDFVNVIGTAQAQKPNGAPNICNTAIFKTKGWFEITNTALMYFSQFEYENTDGVTKAESPLILQGGVFDQFTSTQRTAVSGMTIYIHVGSNVWIKNFGPGTHSDGSTSTPHVPVSVTGGDYEGFYLTGTYNANAAARTDNAECYISGGRFGEAAGASMEQIKGNVRWQIYDADITEFFGGGINDDKPITGTITTEIFNSHVGLFCGGPKFGNMTAGKDVTTTAQGCTFGKFFGAGYGGNSFSRKKYVDDTNYNWNTYQGYYTTDRGKYFNGTSTATASGKNYGSKGPGVSVDFDYEFFVWTSGKTGGRFFVKFVTFSLAQCGNVKSQLTDCTINGDFYGGGSLGKVTGTAKSTLDGCTVNGNVFGGGYSATTPKIPVRRSGFAQVPNYNKSSGMFEPGVFSEIDYYEWKHVDNYPANGASGGLVTENGKNYVITTADLEALGQVANTDLTITGNTKVAGSVFGGGDQSETLGNTDVKVQTVDDNPNYTIGYVFGGGNVANVGGNVKVTMTSGTVLNDVYGGGMQGDVSGNVTVNISKSGTPGTVVIGRDVYGGGALANTNTGNIDSETTMTTNRNVTVVNLYPGATIGHDVYGGGRGQKADNTTNPATQAVEAVVYGNVTVTQYGSILTAAYDNEGQASGGRIFGGNNVNGTPKGHILVHVTKTTGTTGQQRSSNDDRADADATHTYELAAVYGGGNEAEYNPYEDDPDDPKGFAEVIINGCNDVSIHSVYGGGNAASTPATLVTIDGAYEIEYVFGGGNGAGTGNPGANVGYHAYPEDVSGTDQIADRARYIYGSGVATTNIYGGRIHHIYGGSNTRGNVRETAAAMLDEVNDCPLVVDGIYGGGREAYMEGKASLEMGCITGMGEIYGGSEKADVGNDVELTLTSGHFGKVFGGNNKGGRIFGSIKVNIEQTGCVPITIDELYLGGNNAPYSVYGYTNQSYTVDIDGDSVTHYHLNEFGTRLYADPQLNIRSFESIGNVYGGGKGKPATMVGNPQIDINVTQGWVNGKYVGEEPAYTQYKQKPGILPADGVIDTVYGGGNAADVIGNPAIRIGDKMGKNVELKSMQSLHDNLPAGGETKNGITIEKPASGSIKYKAADNNSNTITVEVSQKVKGATISGNVYGGGNQANVTGDTNIQVGPAK